MMSHLGLYLKSCTIFWFGLYLSVCLLLGLPAFFFHATAIGFLLCLISFFRLPQPEPSSVHAFLGPDPRNFDGSPARRQGGVNGAPLGVIAHRGAGLDAPENTICSIELAKKNGAKCVEFDLAFTSDGKAIVFHDEDFDRVTEAKGPVDEMTLEEAQKLDAAHNHIFKNEFSPVRIPTAEEFIDKCLELDLKMIIDLKSWKSPDQTIEYILKLYQNKPELYTKAMVSTFFPHLAYQIRRRNENIIMGMAWRPYFLSLETYTGNTKEAKPRFSSPHYHYLAVLADHVLQWAFHDFMWYFIGLSAVMIHKDYLTKEYIQTWREKGIRVIAWTVNSTPQRVYLTHFLRCTIMSDTMDTMELNDFINEDNQELILNEADL